MVIRNKRLTINGDSPYWSSPTVRARLRSESAISCILRSVPVAPVSLRLATSARISSSHRLSLNPSVANTIVSDGRRLTTWDVASFTGVSVEFVPT